MSGSNNISVNSTSDDFSTPNNVSVNSTIGDFSTHKIFSCQEQLVYLVVYTFICITTILFGIPACVAVLWQLVQKIWRGVPATPNDIFMLNLTVMDLVFVGLPFELLYLWFKMPLLSSSNFIYAFCVTGRPLFMTCICLDCYVAVIHPIMYRARKSLTPRVLMSVGVWAVTLVYGALYAIFDEFMTQHPVSLLPYGFTISTIVICDFFILRALRSSDPGGRDLHPQKKKALQIVINSLVMTLIAYFPPFLGIILVSSISENEEVLLCVLITLSQITAIAGSVVMPILHLDNLGKLDCIWLHCQRRT